MNWCDTDIFSLASTYQSRESKWSAFQKNSVYLCTSLRNKIMWLKFRKLLIITVVLVISVASTEMYVTVHLLCACKWTSLCVCVHVFLFHFMKYTFVHSTLVLFFSFLYTHLFIIPKYIHTCMCTYIWMCMCLFVCSFLPNYFCESLIDLNEQLLLYHICLRWVMNENVLRLILHTYTCVCVKVCACVSMNVCVYIFAVDSYLLQLLTFIATSNYMTFLYAFCVLFKQIITNRNLSKQVCKEPLKQFLLCACVEK